MKKLLVLVAVLFLVTACFDSPEVDTPLDQAPGNDTEQTPENGTDQQPPTDPEQTPDNGDYDAPVDEDFVP